MRHERLTILANPTGDLELIEYLKEKGVSNHGRKLLNLTMLLKRADLLEPLLYVMETGVENRKSATDAVNIALNMAQMVRDDPVPSLSIQERQAAQGAQDKPPEAKLKSPFLAGAKI